MRLFFRHKIFIIFLLSSLIFLFSCKENDKVSRVYLDEWQYSLDGTNFYSLAETPLGNLMPLIPEGKGFITLSSEFTLPWQMLSGDVGLSLGNVKVASKIYLNGKEISEAGIFPPNAFDGGHAYSKIKLDPQIINLDTNKLEIVLWTDGVGSIAGRPFVSTYEDTSHYVNIMNFEYSKLNMIFSWSMILTGIAYLLFYMQQKKDKQYYDYALMSLWTSVYLVPYWISEIPNVIGSVPYELWTKGFSGAVALVVCYYATSFIRSFLEVPTSKKMKICRLALMWGGILIMLLIPNLVLFYKFFWLLVIFLLMELCFGISAIVNEIKKKNPSIIKLLIGYSPVILSVFIDLFVKIIFRNHLAPYLTIYGWQLTAITFIAIVTNRYSKIRNQFEYLNENLEKEVKERTLELTQANEELERRQFEAARDMELAVHVQKSFYPEIPNFKGWDIGLAFKPLSGVSGDLYDFYVIDGKLRGFGLFDVSGHGISSGLVTMLAKNAIFHAFRSTMNVPLNKAAAIVNEQVIQVKGDIENYLTGCMFRIDENNPSEVEFVNAGAPYPVYKSAGEPEATFLCPSDESPQYGMIGVRDLDVQFQVLKKEMKSGDVLVLYTDGVTETENEKGEAFGKDRFCKLLEKKEIMEGSSAQFMANALFQEIKSFAGDKGFEDDITILVLKRTGDESVTGEEELLELEGV